MAILQNKLFTLCTTIALVAGIGRVAIDYTARLLAFPPLFYYLTFFIAFIAEIIIIIYATKKYKSIRGSLTIVDALKVGIGIMGCIGLCYCTMAYVYDIYIDPDFQTNLRLAFTEKYTPEQLDQVKASIEAQNTSQSYLGVIMYTIWFLFLGAVISLITGGVLANKDLKK